MKRSEEGTWQVLCGHRASIRQVLHRFTSDPETLADLEQETLLRALVSLPSLRKPESVRAWLQAIARRLALARTRGARREADLRQEWAILAEQDQPGEAVAAEASLIEWALRQLPAEASQGLRLYYFEGLDGRAMAARLGISEASGRQRLHRGRRQLKEMIMNAVRDDEEMAEQLVARLLRSARSLAVDGKYQEAVDKYLGAERDFPDRSTYLSQLPVELRHALSEAWAAVFEYSAPEGIEEPEGVIDEEAWSKLLLQLPERERLGLVNGTIEDIARRLQISPAWVYLWWKQGMPHRRDPETGTVRFHLGVVRQWLQENGVLMPARVGGAESYHLVRGIAQGVREGLLAPEDVEVLVNVFIEREQTQLYRRGSYFSLRDVGEGASPLAQESLREGAGALTRVHEAAVEMRHSWTPNCGYTGAYPYDVEGARRLADDLRGVVEGLQEGVTSLGMAVEALEKGE